MTTPPPQASPSRQSNIPANSRRSKPRVSLAAWSPNNLTQRRHGGSPLEHRTTAAGRLPPHLLGPNLNHRVPTPIIPRLASITTPLRWIRAKGAVQSAYDQAVISRRALIEDGYELADKSGKPFSLSEAIDDAFMICVTGVHYPALSVQVKTYLQKTSDDPSPLAVSIFDLEILLHYLNDPTDILYYLKQRTKYAFRFFPTSELALLGYHIEHKLVPVGESGLAQISGSWAQMVSFDYPNSKGYWRSSDHLKKLGNL